MFGQSHPCRSFLDLRLTPFVLSNGKLDCICWREIYNSFVFPRWNPGQAVSSEILNEFVGRTVTSKNSIFAVELELKVKETIDSYANTNTVFSHTLFSRANGLVWSCLLNILQTCLGGLPFLKTHGLREHSCVQVRTLSESTSIQFALTTLPRNLILGTRKVHLSMLSVRPASLRRSNTFCNL